MLVEHGVAQSLVDLAGDATVTAPPLPAASPRHALSPCSQRAWLVGREHPAVRDRLEISVGTHIRPNRHDGAGRCIEGVHLTGQRPEGDGTMVVSNAGAPAILVLAQLPQAIQLLSERRGHWTHAADAGRVSAGRANRHPTVTRLRHRDGVRMRRRGGSAAGGVSHRPVLSPEQVDALVTLHCSAQQGSPGGLGRGHRGGTGTTTATALTTRQSTVTLFRRL